MTINAMCVCLPHCRHPKGCLALFILAAFIGATTCSIIHPHGYAVCLFVGGCPGFDRYVFGI